MHKLSPKSLSNLSNVHPDLVKIVLTTIEISLVDLGISRGHSTKEFQFELFKKGRAFDGKNWNVINPKDVVTNCDGYTKPSEHNNYPSTAIDFFAVVAGFPNEIYNQLQLQCKRLPKCYTITAKFRIN